MNSRIAVALLAIGGVLIAASYFWPQLVGGRNAWTHDDAAQLTTVQTELHSLREQAGTAMQKQKAGTGDAAQSRLTTEKLEAAEGRYKHLSARLEIARGKGETAAVVFRWAGIAVALVGAIGLSLNRTAQ